MIWNEEVLLKLLEDVEINTDVYALTQDKRGNANLQIKANGKEWSLHSRYDAVKEGQAFARKHAFAGDMVVLGLGFGYHVKALLSSMNQKQTLYVLESNLQVLKLAFENTDIRRCLGDERVQFFAGSGMKSMKKILYTLILVSNNCVIAYEPAIMTDPAGIKVIADALHLKEFELKVTQKMDLSQIRKQIDAMEPLEQTVNVAFIGFVIKLGSSYRHFARNLEVGFKLLGCKVDFLTTDEFKFALANPKELPWDFFITFNTHMNDIEYGGKSFFDVADRTLISIGIDRPYHLANSDMKGPKNALYTWTSRDDLEYAGKFYFTAGRHNFLAHGAEVLFEWKNTPGSKRFMDVLITSNMLDKNWIEEMENNVEKRDFSLFKDIAEYSILHMDKTLEECVVDCVSACDDHLLKEIMHKVGFYIDAYRRETLKYKIVKSLLDAGMEIHCVGGGWEYTGLIDHPLFIWHGSVGFDTCRELIGCSKILINIMPAFLDGAHERIFDSIIRETLCLVEGNNYLREIFTDGKHIVFYDHTNIPDMAEKIRYYLDNDTEREKITKAAFEKVRNEHTWAHRAKEIIDIWRNEK